MSKLSKNTIITIIVAAVVIIGGIFYLAGQQKQESFAPQEPAPPEGEEAVLTLAGRIVSISPGQGFVIVNPSGEDKEVKVFLPEGAEIIKLKFPFEPGQAPAEGTFTPEQIPITIDELEIGNSFLLETATDLTGKTEINDVIRVQVLP